MRDILVKRIEVLTGYLWTYVYIVSTDGKRYERNVTRSLRAVLSFVLGEAIPSQVVRDQVLDTLEYHFKHKPKNASIINFKEPFKVTVK